MQTTNNASGWNRPKTNEQNSSKARESTRAVIVRGTIALFVVVALGCLALWLFSNKTAPTPVDQSAKRTSIKDTQPKTPAKGIVDAATPAVTTKVVQATSQEEKVVNSRKAPSTAKKYPRRVIPRKPEPPQRFKYDSDDLIAGFLEIAPGDQVEGGLRFDKIGRDFDKSLLEDIALAEGQDNPENQKLREWVRETKKEIQKVMKAENKTFGQVMQEQFDQLIELGQYKRNLEQELREIRKSGEYTPDEYAKFIEASNAMLRGNGCSELKVPKATFYQVELYRQRRAAKEAMGLEKETKESKEAATAAMQQGETEE